MKDLKIALFEETLYTLNRWMGLKKELGDYDRLTDLLYGGFKSLYTVIEDSGLVDEFQEWKEKQQVNEKG